MNQHICSKCGKELANRHSLSRHKKNCQSDAVAGIGQKRSASNCFNEIPTFEGSEFLPGKAKSKDTLARLERFVSRPLPRVVEVPRTNNNIQRTVTMNLSADGEPSLKKFKSVMEKSLPRLDVVQFSDSDDANDSSDDDGTIDISDLPPPDKEVKFLPATISGLRTRFAELLKHIAVVRKAGGQEKVGDRNEAVFLLDELKRQGGISPGMYREYNDFLAESLPVGFGVSDQEEAAMEIEDEDGEEEENEDQLKKEITSTADYLIEHDKNELMEIVAEIEKDDNIIEAVTALEDMIKIYLEREFLNKESVAVGIHELVDRLSGSEHIPKSTLLKIKMLVNDIAENRERVKEIVNRFNLAGDDKEMRLWVIEQLAKEELISEQQYFKLAEEIDDIDVKKLTNIIGETKIGQGVNFLPRTTGELFDKLLEWVSEFAKNGGIALQSMISAALNELFRRKKISKQRYDEMKEQHNIF